MIEYANLSKAIDGKGIRKTAIARSLGVSPRTFNNKMKGRSAFTWPEVCIIHEKFFPEIDRDFLFASKVSDKPA